MFATHTGDGTTPATGKVVPLYREIDPAGNPVYKKIDGTVYTPDAALETIDADPIRVMLGDEILAVDGTVKAFASVPANAALAEVQVHVGEDHLCFTTSGKDPDPVAHRGRLANAGDYLHIEGADELAKFKAIALANDGSGVGTAVNLYVEYFNVTEDGTYIR